MAQLTPEGQQVAQDLAQRHGFSVDAVTQMMQALLQGNGSQAQFSHPEFGGSGQWMQGGMIMLGDMFNNQLKGRVDSLCHEIAGILARQPGLLRTGSFQSQSQSGGQQQQSGDPGYQGQSSGSSQQQQFGGLFSQHPSGHGSSLFLPDPNQNWWPQELGSPSATGSQNNMHYAYFAGSRRLAVKTGSEVWVYDTQDHQIGGFSQQQSGGSSITFTSQYGTVNLATLPVISRNGHPVPPASGIPNTAPSRGNGNSLSESDIYAALEKLGDLKAKGILTDEEFTTKKAELLSRL